MSRPVLILDLDGTLVDTAPDLLGTLNAILATRSLPPVPLESVHHLVGHGARVMLKRGFEFSGAPLDAGELDRLFDRFLEHYSANIAVESRPFAGVKAALERFADDGWALAVCTNKLERLARLLLDELGMTSRFDAIVGGDTFERAKPDAMPLLGAISMAGGDPARSVMVGDSATDINAARAAGIPVVAVDFGYTPVPVTELGPDRVISHFDALWEAVRAVSPAPAPAQPQ